MTPLLCFLIVYSWKQSLLITLHIFFLFSSFVLSPFQESMGLWQGVGMDFLMFYLGPPCPTPLHPTGNQRDNGLPPWRADYGRLLPFSTPRAVRLWESLFSNVKDSFPVRFFLVYSRQQILFEIAFRSFLHVLWLFKQSNPRQKPTPITSSLFTKVVFFFRKMGHPHVSWWDAIRKCSVLIFLYQKNTFSHFFQGVRFPELGKICFPDEKRRRTENVLDSLFPLTWGCPIFLEKQMITMKKSC
jgi:hypothetical protein